MFDNGIINIDKPADWTSQDVTAKLRRRLHIRRVGHTGTLDPMATGVLPVCFGKATRIIEYFDADLKTYRAEMQLGLRTDTLDITGTVTESHPVDVTESEIEDAFRVFDGWITQIPPKYSALKVNGRPLYKYAREGRDVEIRPRRTYIESLTLNRIDMASGRIEFTVCCSKGTYIRTICDDVGSVLGCGAAMSALTRVQSGFFSLGDALPLAAALEMSNEELATRIVPMDRPLTHLGVVRLKSNQSVPFYRNGRPIDREYLLVEQEPDVPGALLEKCALSDKYRVYDADGHFLGVSRLEENVFYPEKVII